MGHNKIISILVAVVVVCALPTAVLTAGSLPFTGVEIPDGTHQAVVVRAIGDTDAVLSCWDKTDSRWNLHMADVAAVLGRSGLVPPERKAEGDGATPGGVYDLRIVFGYAPRYDTKMPYIPLTDRHY